SLPTGFCLRYTSYIRSAAETDAFRLVIWPTIGILTMKSHFSSVFLLIPLPSLPMTKAVFTSAASSRKSIFPLPSLPAIQNPLSFSVSIVWLTFVTLTTGTCSIAPVEVLATVSVSCTDRRFGMITPSKPVASHVLRIEPRLCGSSSPSRMTRFARLPSILPSSVSNGMYSWGLARATTPWWRSSVSPSILFFGTAWTTILRFLAASSISRICPLLIESCIITLLMSALLWSASLTAWRPAITESLIAISPSFYDFLHQDPYAVLCPVKFEPADQRLYPRSIAVFLDCGIFGAGRAGLVPRPFGHIPFIGRQNTFVFQVKQRFRLRTRAHKHVRFPVQPVRFQIRFFLYEECADIHGIHRIPQKGERQGRDIIQGEPSHV